MWFATRACLADTICGNATEESGLIQRIEYMYELRMGTFSVRLPWREIGILGGSYLSNRRDEDEHPAQ